MKTKKKSPVVIDFQLLNVFKDIYPENEAQKAMRDAKKAFKVLQHDPFFSSEVLNYA